MNPATPDGLTSWMMRELYKLSIRNIHVPSKWEFVTAGSVNATVGAELSGGLGGMEIQLLDPAGKMAKLYCGFAMVGFGGGAAVSVAPTDFPNKGTVFRQTGEPDFMAPIDFAGPCYGITGDVVAGIVPAGVPGGVTATALFLGISQDLIDQIKEIIRCFRMIEAASKPAEQGLMAHVRAGFRRQWLVLTSFDDLLGPLGAILLRIAEMRVARGVIMMAGVDTATGAYAGANLFIGGVVPA